MRLSALIRVRAIVALRENRRFEQRTRVATAPPLFVAFVSGWSTARPCLRFRTTLAALGLLLLCAPASGEEQLATITGGQQDDGSYRWVVTNQSSTPIVSLEFPHYQADMFYAPPGWKSKSTFLVNVGVPDRPGTCRTWVDSPAEGIPRRGNVSLGMRVRQLEAGKGVGVVKVGFADGTMIDINDVEVPTTPGLIERFGVLFVFAIFFGLVVLIAARRRRKAAAAQSFESGEPE